MFFELYDVEWYADKSSCRQDEALLQLSAVRPFWDLSKSWRKEAKQAFSLCSSRVKKSKKESLTLQREYYSCIEIGT